MRVLVIVVRQPAWEVGQHGLGIWDWGNSDVIALDGSHERLGHAVGLRALDRRCPGLKPDVSRESLGNATQGPPPNFHLPEFAARSFGAFQDDAADIVLRLSSEAVADARRFLFTRPKPWRSSVTDR